ncbi:MAG: flagellar motor protein MotB [Clostridia bacterium]|nr:flagellar motor protein MotB [Clostridia bacterium]
MRKRGQAGGGGGGGAHDNTGAMRWLLTYADLITLLMVFFVVLYSMSQLDQQKFITLSNALRASLFGEQSANAVIRTTAKPSLVPENLPEQETLAELGKELREDVERAGLADKVTITLDNRGLVVSFSAEAAFFQLGRADLQPAFKDLLLRLAPSLNKVQNPIEVDGYTDDLQINTAEFPTNWELSARRATNVVRFLSEVAGVDPHRLSAQAFGEFHPTYSNATDTGRARNRRVDLVVLRKDARDTGQALVILGPSEAPPPAPKAEPQAEPAPSE